MQSAADHTPHIHGSTRLMALIGDPVAQARSPRLVNDALARRGLGQAVVFVPMQVPPAGLRAVLHSLRHMGNVAGAVITMPHKTAALEQVDSASRAAQLAGAVNVIRREPDGRLTGTLLDGLGFVAGLATAAHPVRGRRCVLAGAGGAASAVALALVEHGCGALHIVNRTVAKAASLVQRLRAAHPLAPVHVGLPPGGEIDLLVNGTSLGMGAHDAMPFDDEVIARAALVADCVVAPEHTALLQRAQALGKATHHGVHMLQAQVDLMVDFMSPELRSCEPCRAPP